jgi:asparagine synthase (glutamine-hydrolysing)
LRASSAGKVPDDIRLNRQKQGFNAPLNSVLDLTAPATREWLLDESPIFDLVDRERFSGFIANADERNSHSKFLFNFISAKIFLEIAG